MVRIAVRVRYVQAANLDESRLTVTDGKSTEHSCRVWTCSPSEDRVLPGSHRDAAHSPPRHEIYARRSSSLTTDWWPPPPRTTTCQPASRPFSRAAPVHVPKRQPSLSDPPCIHQPRHLLCSGRFSEARQVTALRQQHQQSGLDYSRLLRAQTSRI